MVPPTRQNTAGVCNEITCLVHYHISSRLVTLLKINDAPTEVSNIFLSYCLFQVHQF